MTNSWETDNCAAMKAHYAIYSIPQAAALWCGVPEEKIPTILEEAHQLSATSLGRSIWVHPDVPCLEPRSRAIAEAIEGGSLPHGREDGKTVEDGDHVAYERRHFFGRELRKWMKKTFPNDKPAFLFDDIEQQTHSAINADSFRALQADRDALKNRIKNATQAYRKLREEKEKIEAERDSLKAMVDNYSTSRKLDKADNSNRSLLSQSIYWSDLGRSAVEAIAAFPTWRQKQRKIQKTGNLKDWLIRDFHVKEREAEILKKVLSDIFPELN